MSREVTVIHSIRVVHDDGWQYVVQPDESNYGVEITYFENGVMKPIGNNLVMTKEMAYAVSNAIRTIAEKCSG